MPFLKMTLSRRKGGGGVHMALGVMCIIHPSAPPGRPPQKCPTEPGASLAHSGAGRKHHPLELNGDRMCVLGTCGGQAGNRLGIGIRYAGDTLGTSWGQAAWASGPCLHISPSHHRLELGAWVLPVLPRQLSPCLPSQAPMGPREQRKPGPEMRAGMISSADRKALSRASSDAAAEL